MGHRRKRQVSMTDGSGGPRANICSSDEGCSRVVYLELYCFFVGNARCG